MVSVTSETVFFCLATVVLSCQMIDATIFGGKDQEEVPQDLPVAEERIFKGKKLSPLLEKKKGLVSLLTRTAEPQVVHALSPIEHYPIWKVHKYKGIELRPVQVVDIPSPFDYSPVQPEYYRPAVQYGAPAVEPVRVPHTEYGTPVVDYNSFNAPVRGITKPEEPTKITSGGDFHHMQIQAPYQGFHHGGKLKALLAFLRSHGGLLTKLRNLKSWKSALKHGGAFPHHHGVLLPEVHEIPVKGLENLHLKVPELPAVGLPSYSSAVTGGPYVKVQVATPVPVVNYQTPEYQYAPQYEYQYPPQYNSEYSLSDEYGPPPARAPASYYGPPQLFNSYGMPLPADAYSSAPSDQVLSFAVPEKTPEVRLQDQSSEGFNASNSTLTGTQTKSDELPAEEEGNQEVEESRKVSEDGIPKVQTIV